jgi:hypothetical protein
MACVYGVLRTWGLLKSNPFTLIIFVFDMPLKAGDGRIRKHARSGDGVRVVRCLRGPKE